MTKPRQRQDPPVVKSRGVAELVGIAMMAAIAVATAWWTGIYKWVFPPPAPPIAASLTIDCVDAQFPLTVEPTATMCGLIVGKGKAVYTCAAAQDAVWTRILTKRHSGFRCQITNNSKASMVSVSMWIPIQFQSAHATVRAREESLLLGQSLEQDTPFDLYVFDDSDWDPLVKMPNVVMVRLQGEIESKPVTVAYPGGEVANLSGFDLP